MSEEEFDTNATNNKASSPATTTTTITVKVVRSPSDSDDNSAPSLQDDGDVSPTTTNDSKTTTTTTVTKQSSNGVFLPPIDHILKSIDVYQTQQQLSDSQLLLEFNQRQHVHSPQIRQSSIDSTSEDSTGPQAHSKNTLNHSYQQENYSLSFTRDAAGSNLSSHASSTTTTTTTTTITTSTTPYQFKTEDPSIPNKRKRTEQQSTNTTSNQGFETPSRQSSVDSLDSLQSGGSMNTPNSLNGKKRTNLPRETIEILNDWILNNMDNPYPNHTQKRILLERTGLSNVQLSNWFINKRRRRIFSNLSGNNGQPIKKKRLIDRI